MVCILQYKLEEGGILPFINRTIGFGSKESDNIIEFDLSLGLVLANFFFSLFRRKLLAKKDHPTTSFHAGALSAVGILVEGFSKHLKPRHRRDSSVQKNPTPETVLRSPLPRDLSLQDPVPAAVEHLRASLACRSVNGRRLGSFSFRWALQI